MFILTEYAYIYSQHLGLDIAQSSPSALGAPWNLPAGILEVAAVLGSV